MSRINTEHYEKIVELLGVSGSTAEDLLHCIREPHAYYQENAERYQERSLSSPEDTDSVIWLGMVDILIEHGKMCEFDFCEELGEFVYGIKEISPLPFDETLLHEDDEITGWCKELGRQWAESGYVAAAMDIDSDSYCVFVTTANIFQQLAEIAWKTGHKIALAQDL